MINRRFIVSHIKVLDGGDIQDYPHYHHVRFQMIYCLKGWVKLVYEDQGEFLFYFIIQGHISIELEGELSQLTKGSTCVMPANCIYTLSGISKTFEMLDPFDNKPPEGLVTTPSP